MMGVSPHLVSGVYAASLAVLIMSRHINSSFLAIFLNYNDHNDRHYHFGTHEAVCLTLMLCVSPARLT
jgi:hypothetical protein